MSDCCMYYSCFKSDNLADLNEGVGEYISE